MQDVTERIKIARLDLQRRHRVYGLNVESSELLPGLSGHDHSGTADSRIYIQSCPVRIPPDLISNSRIVYASPVIKETGKKNLIVWKDSDGGGHRFHFQDGTDFIIDREGSEIWVQWEEPYTIEDVTTYLLGPIYGFILRLRGYVCLHASAIVCDEEAIALIGPAGAGKSTTAAAFAHLGYRVITEDVTALIDRGGDRFQVIPGYPLIRLWPESVRMLYGSSDALPPLTPNWDKRYLALDLNRREFQTAPLPLGAVYFLRERKDDSTAPSIVGISGGSGLLDLVANTYTNYLLDREMRAHEFEVLGRLRSSVPLRSVTPHADPARLPDLCRAIVADYRRLQDAR